MLLMLVVVLLFSLLLFASNRPVAPSSITEARHQLTETDQGILPTTKNASKPKFFLHVGLHKTGTTFLQQSLCGKAEFTQPLFLENNLVYLGTCEGSQNQPEFVRHGKYLTIHTGGYNDVLEHGSVPEPAGGHNLDYRFVGLIKALQTKGHNVLFVFEGLSYFSPTMIDQLKALLVPFWDVEVLVMHRTFHDWILSFHNQLFKPKRGLRSWAKPLLPFDLENKEASTSAIFDAAEKYGKHPAQAVQQLYQNHFERVTLAHLDDLKSMQADGSKGDPLMEYILCTFVNASKLCQQEQQTGAFDSASANARQDITFHLLAQEAWSQGLVPDSAPRGKVAARIQLELRARKETSASLPKICPSNPVMEKFETVSRQADRNAYNGGSSSSSRWTDETMIAHRQSFQKLINEGKLCYVDSQKVLSTGEWNAVFQDIQ